jgi:hypothetical protein
MYAAIRKCIAPACLASALLPENKKTCLPNVDIKTALATIVPEASATPKTVQAQSVWFG